LSKPLDKPTIAAVKLLSKLENPSDLPVEMEQWGFFFKSKILLSGPATGAFARITRSGRASVGQCQVVDPETQSDWPLSNAARQSYSLAIALAQSINQCRSPAKAINQSALLAKSINRCNQVC
jgi:hypothetical protein